MKLCSCHVTLVWFQSIKEAILKFFSLFFIYLSFSCNQIFKFRLNPLFHYFICQGRKFVLYFIQWASLICVCAVDVQFWLGSDFIAALIVLKCLRTHSSLDFCPSYTALGMLFSYLCIWIHVIQMHRLKLHFWYWSRVFVCVTGVNLCRYGIKKVSGFCSVLFAKIFRDFVGCQFLQTIKYKMQLCLICSIVPVRKCHASSYLSGNCLALMLPWKFVFYY